MVTRYEFGYGEGEIRRRRRRNQEEMSRRAREEAAHLPDRSGDRIQYGSDYYGFRGAGTRKGLRRRRRTERRGPPGEFRRAGSARRWRH